MNGKIVLNNSYINHSVQMIRSILNVSFNIFIFVFIGGILCSCENINHEKISIIEDGYNIDIQKKLEYKYSKVQGTKIKDTIIFTTEVYNDRSNLIFILNSITSPEISFSLNDVKDSVDIGSGIKRYYISNNQFNYYTFSHEKYGLIYAVRVWGLNEEYELFYQTKLEDKKELEKAVSFSRNKHIEWWKNNYKPIKQ